MALRPRSEVTGPLPRTPGNARATTRARRPQTALFRWILLWIVLLSVFAIAYVGETAAATQASYQIGNLKLRRAELQAEQQQIRYQISLATSAGQIDGDAARFGMVRSSQWQYLQGSNSPVALAKPEPPTNAGVNRSLVEQLALIVGRPTEAQAKGR